MKTRDKFLIPLTLIAILWFAGTVYADLTATEGLAIDLSSAGAGTDMTIAFDPTEITGGTTWDDGGDASVIWTWNLTAGDPSFTFGNGFIAADQDFKITGDDLFMNTNTTGYILRAAGYWLRRKALPD